MKKSLLFVAVIVILFAGFIGLNKQNRSVNTAQNIPTPTLLTQEQITPTLVVTRFTTQVQGQEKTVPLTILEPMNNASTSNQSITVRGKTIGNADISVNEKDLKADAQGNFSIVVSLDDGENIIAVLVVDQAGNFVEQDLTVTFNSGTQ